MKRWIGGELLRLLRGIGAMRDTFGWQFTGGILLVMGLLLWAVFHIHGGLIAVLCLLLVLLAIRAHDLGELEPEPEGDEDPTEFTGFWADTDEAKQRAARAQAEFLRSRDAAALGKPHEPGEL